MNTRKRDLLIEQLRREVAAIQHIIEEVIHLDGMQRALHNAESKFEIAKQNQQKFYRDCNIPFTISNQNFLNNDTQQGRFHQAHIQAITRDIDSIRGNIQKLERERDVRMKPLNDLIEHVTTPDTKVNEKYVSALLNTARVLNPEGSILDRIKCIGNIIKSILTLRCYEISDIHTTQQKHNTLRHTITTFFRAKDMKELPANIILPSVRKIT